MKNYYSLLQSSHLFRNISQQDLDAMLHCMQAEIRTFEKGTLIYHTGDCTDSLGILLSGKLVISLEDLWGNRNILSTVLPGQTFADSYACCPQIPMTVNVSADLHSNVLFLKIAKVMTICSSACSHHHAIIRNLLSEIAMKNLSVSEKLIHVGQRSTRAKLLSFLSMEMRKKRCRTFDIPFNRQQLADYLTVDRSGLSIELGKLQKEGILTFHKNRFEILDPSISLFHDQELF